MIFPWWILTRDVKCGGFIWPSRAYRLAEHNRFRFTEDHASGTIYVALAAINAVGVLRVVRGKGVTYSYRCVFEVGAFPTALYFSALAKTLFVADGRNPVTGPNAPPGATAVEFPKIGTVIGGGIETFSEATLHNLAECNLWSTIYGQASSENDAGKGRIAYFSRAGNWAIQPRR
jgi:hypothetical protein